MSTFKIILTMTAAVGFVNAVSPRLSEVMSAAAGYEVQLHSNVTAYDVCRYLATGYQYNEFAIDKNITTEAYDDHDQGVAKVLTRFVNDEYDNTTEALNSYNKTQTLLNFNPASCEGVTENEVIGWYFPSTEAGTHERILDRGRRDAIAGYCNSPGENCFSSEGKLDVALCTYWRTNWGPPSGTSCGCAEYGTSAAACQTSYLKGTVWYTDQHENWGDVTALMIWFLGGGGRSYKKLVGFINSGKNYS